MDEKQASF